MKSNEKMFEFMHDRSPQRDQCVINLLGDFIDMFLSVFSTDDMVEVEDYVYEGVRYFSATGYMKGDWCEWDQWISDNKVTATLTQGFMDSDYDYYLSEKFVEGKYIDYDMDITCHSCTDEAEALLEVI